MKTQAKDGMPFACNNNMDALYAQLGPWAGFHVHGDTLITDTGETYTAGELRLMRWERNQWAAAARAMERELSDFAQKALALFTDDELATIRDALRVLDGRLPGCKLAAPEPKRGRRAA